MSLMHITKDGRCAYCHAKQVLCEVCKEFFYPTKRGHRICSDRCRTRKHRLKIRDELDLDDE